MPRDMTMHEPNTGIIRPEGQRQEPARRQQSHIAAGRIVEIEGWEVLLCVKGAVFLGQDDKVVAVEVDWVGCRDGFLAFGDVLAGDY